MRTLLRPKRERAPELQDGQRPPGPRRGRARSVVECAGPPALWPGPRVAPTLRAPRRILPSGLRSLAVWVWTIASAVLAADEAADAWLTESPLAGANHPAAIGTNVLTGAFASLAAVAGGGGMVVRCGLGDLPGGEASALYVSTDPPDHWRVRDWRAYRWRRADETWEARVPLSSIEVPTLYFVQTVVSGTNRVSPMRVFRPGLAGLTSPTHPFTGFVDGFEEGAGGWELVSGTAGAAGLSITNQAWSGRGALRVEVAARRGSATIGTARLRGWMFVEHNPRALAMVARTAVGPGRLRLALHSDARSPELVMHPAATEFELGPVWQRVEVPVASFAGLRTAEVDWFTIQFLAEPGSVLLLDDLELVLP